VTFLPIVERELRISARRKGTHWLRFFAALVVITVVFILLLGSPRSTSSPQLAQHIFLAVSVLAFGFSLFAGVFLTSDCLCSERRDGTLGLLFLTDLKGYDVVLGKLAATSLVSVYALLGIIPMLGLPLLMGGVSLGEFGRMTLVLLLTLMLSLASGMLASAVCRDTRSAMMASFGMMLGLTGGLFLVALVANQVGGSTLMYWWLLPSPLAAFFKCTDGPYAVSAGHLVFWGSISLLAGLSLVQLAVASLWLPRSWRQREADAGQVTHRVAARAQDRWALRPNPFQWLLCRERFLPRPARLLLTLLFAAWLGFCIAIPFVGANDGGEMFITAFFIAFGLHVVVKGLLALQATRRTSEDCRTGAMELLLVTPLSPAAIIDGHWQVLRQQFAWLNGGLVTINLAMIGLMVVFRESLHMDAEVIVVFSLFFLGGVVLLWVDFKGIGWLGLWMGLRGLRHHRAALNTWSRILVPPWVLIFLFIFTAAQGGVSRDTLIFSWMIWLSLSIVNAHIAVMHRKSELLHSFRRLAAGDKPLVAFDALQPWAPGLKSEEIAAAHSRGS
jgi:ABC-type transport system involved in cytochrome c biogenesis permease component